MCSMWGGLYMSRIVSLYTSFALATQNGKVRGEAIIYFFLAFVIFLFDATKKGQRSRIS